MSDDRVTVATAKQINLAQLDDELAALGLNVDEVAAIIGSV